MQKVGFFTAVSFGDRQKSCTQSLLETVDSYFFLGGKKAYVIAGHAQQASQGTILRNDFSTPLVTAIKVISYATLILPAIMLIAKIVLRSTHTFYLIQNPRRNLQPHPLDPNSRSRPLHPHSNPTNSIDRSEAQKKLEEGIDISHDTITKIQRLMPKIIAREEDTEIQWHTRSGNLVFSLTSLPQLIFKMAPPGRYIVRERRILSAEELSESRFANMVKAVEVCTANRLDLLVIPHAKKFNVDGMTLIAEEYLNISQNESAQEHLYHLSGLDETVKQLATFIAKTGFSDVSWRNMPLVDTAPTFEGNRRVALVDLEEMEGAEGGIFGTGLGARGLVSCLHSAAQIDIVLAEAQRQGIRNRHSSFEQVKADRMQEIESDKQLQEFYRKNGILEDPRKPVQVDDLTTLGLNLNEKGPVTILKSSGNGSGGKPSSEYTEEPTTLGEVVVYVIAHINRAITKAPETASIKGKRYILLNTNDNRRLKRYNQLGLPKGKFVITQKEEEQLWLRRIINALVAKGHLFKLQHANGYGYFIQV